MESSNTVIAFPHDQAARMPNLAFDIGGSVTKVIHRECKKNGTDFKTEESQLPSKNQVQYRVKSFPREHLGELIKYAKANCAISLNQENVYSTGLGGNEFKVKIEEALNVKVNNLNEFRCFISGLNKMLSVFGKDAFLAAPPQDTEPNKHEGFLPCLLVTCGSATAFTKVNKDGSGHLVDGSVIGGRSFLGLSNLLTGVKDFSQLIEMASEGDGSRVDMYAGDLKDTHVKGDFYSEVRDDIKMYAFGKATLHGREEFRSGDLARSLLEMTCSNVVQLAHANAVCLDLKNIYFCGSFTNSELTRRFISESSHRRNMRCPPEFQVEIKFLRHGSYLGVIGALNHGEENHPDPTPSPLEEHSKIQK